MNVRWSKLTEFYNKQSDLKPDGKKLISLRKSNTKPVLHIEPGMEGLNEQYFKKIEFFKSAEQANIFRTMFFEYESLLDSAGITIPESDCRVIEHKKKSNVFIAQQKIEPQRQCINFYHSKDYEKIRFIFRAILDNLQKISEFNRINEPQIIIGIDSLLSNWYIINYTKLKVKLGYLDTSMPRYLIQEKEQVSVHTFFRKTPGRLKHLLYSNRARGIGSYGLRDMLIELIAGFFQHDRPDLATEMLPEANRCLMNHLMLPLSIEETRSHYRKNNLARLFWRPLKIFRGLNPLNKNRVSGN